MDVRELHHRCCDHWIAVVDGVTVDDLGQATPCDEWAVRDLIEHVTDDNLWVEGILSGRPFAEIDDPTEGRTPPADPVPEAVETTRAAVALADAADPDAMVHVSFGTIPVAEYLHQRSVDALIHGWDLARATGADEGLPGELVDALWTWAEPMAEVLGSMPDIIGPPVEVGDSATTQDKLLGLLGRHP